MEISFPIWLCRTASYLRSDKDSDKREQNKARFNFILPSGGIFEFQLKDSEKRVQKQTEIIFPT